jgi:hypothetical protein
VYALQAGREIRVMVKPGEIDDDGAVLLSHEIAREIEDQLEYPGQVKVTVIRESRAIDVARHMNGAGQPAPLPTPESEPEQPAQPPAPAVRDVATEP